MCLYCHHIYHANYQADQVFEQMIYDATNSSDGPPRCPEGGFKHALKYDHLLLATPHVGRYITTL